MTHLGGRVAETDSLARPPGCSTALVDQLRTTAMEAHKATAVSYWKSARKGSALATNAVETQDKGSLT